MAKVIIIDDALRDQFAALSSRQPSLSPPSPATEAAAAAALVSSPVALHSRSSLSSEASPTSVADVAATGAAAGRGRLLKFRLPCDSSDRLFLLKGGFLYELHRCFPAYPHRRFVWFVPCSSTWRFSIVNVICAHCCEEQQHRI